jgi:lysophospholipase L1-like esterase
MSAAFSAMAVLSATLMGNALVLQDALQAACGALPPHLSGGARERAEDPPEAAPLRAFMRRLRAPGAPLLDPCTSPPAPGTCACARTALEPFYASLDATLTRDARTAVAVFGNSLIAADGVTSVIRARLTQQFTDGGRGLLLADRIGDVGPRARTAHAASGWRVESCASDLERTTPLGATGVQHVSEGPAFSRFKLRGESQATIFWAGRAPLSLRVDDGPWQRLEAATTDANATDHAHVTQLALEPTQHTLTLRAHRGGAVVQGVSLERGRGVVLDTLGVPSADAGLWLSVDEETFRTQLAARAPSLVMLMLGGNEAKRITWGRSSRDDINRDLRALIARVRDATGAACLVIGPIDAVVGADHDDPWRERPSLRDVIDIERTVAREEGCAFLDLYAAMGGRGSLSRLADADALWDDYVHPRGRDLDMLGQLVVDALLDGYARSQPATLAEIHQPSSAPGGT